MLQQRMGVGAKCQGNAGKFRGMPEKRMGVGTKYQGNVGECRVFPVECMAVCAKCNGNVGGCQGKNGSGRKTPEEHRGMQGNARVT